LEKLGMHEREREKENFGSEFFLGWEKSVCGGLANYSLVRETDE
jgi:hypothetical protein